MRKICSGKGIPKNISEVIWASKLVLQVMPHSPVKATKRDHFFRPDYLASVKWVACLALAEALPRGITLEANLAGS
jgi:hypothetical protein